MTWRNTVERLRRRYVTEQNECWVWTGGIAKNGYSKVRINNRYQSGHRAFYEHYKGPIPGGLQIDHLCRNKRCVNPDHLEAVTARVNTRRSDNLTARKARQTHCIRGHPLSGDNLYVTPKDGRRQCRICRGYASARHYHGRAA